MLFIVMDENQTLQIIKVYKVANIVWDANRTVYCNEINRNDRLERIANEFNIVVSTVKVKIKNLRSYFSKRRHKSLKIKSDTEK